MDEREIRRRTRAVVKEMAPLQEEEVTASSSLVVDLGYDSLGLVELLVALERELGMSAEERDEIVVETVSDVEARVVELFASRPLSSPSATEGMKG